MYLRRHSGTNTTLLSKDEVIDKYPYISSEDLKGAIWIPEDITVNSREITKLLSQLAQQNG